MVVVLHMAAEGGRLIRTKDISVVCGGVCGGGAFVFLGARAFLRVLYERFLAT